MSSTPLDFGINLMTGGELNQKKRQISGFQIVETGSHRVHGVPTVGTWGWITVLRERRPGGCE